MFIKLLRSVDMRHIIIFSPFKSDAIVLIGGVQIVYEGIIENG